MYCNQTFYDVYGNRNRGQYHDYNNYNLRFTLSDGTKYDIFIAFFPVGVIKHSLVNLRTNYESTFGKHAAPVIVPQSNALCPEIVGEGEVTSIILPDGTFQYYFKPTVKWCTPPTTNTYPLQCVNAINTNHNNVYYNSNLGVWFIRSIDNPIFACNTNCYLPQEGLRPALSSEYNLNPFHPGYQLKFHNDKWTSTTDIHYFYPCLRQFDCTFSFPARGYAAVQVDTPITNTSCHGEIVCSKPCNCISKQHQLQKPTSAMSLVDTSYEAKEIIREYPGKSQSSHTDIQQRQLLPSDVLSKRIQIPRKLLGNNQSNNITCQCSTHIYDKSTITYTDSGNGPKMDVDKETQSQIQNDPKKRLQHEFEPQKAGKRESKNVDCECNSLMSLDNCNSTYTDLPCASKYVTNVERGKCCKPASNSKNANASISDCTDKFETEIWCPKSASSKKIFGLVQTDTGI